MGCRLRFVTACIVAAGIIGPAALAQAQSTLIPLTTRRDLVFDHAGRYLYITTSDGWVRRYDLATAQLESGYNIGGSLNGTDIAPDDSFLLLAQSATSGANGRFQKLELASGSVSNIEYARAFQETGAWDVAIASNGLALCTTQLSGSGETPLRQIDLTTSAITSRDDLPVFHNSRGVQGGTMVHRSADGTRLYFPEVNNSSGPLFTYDAHANSFSQRVAAEMYFGVSGAAVNRDGSLLATLVGVQAGALSRTNIALDTAPDLRFMRSLTDADGGVAFSAVEDTVYAVSSTSGEIVAMDTNTFTERFRIPIGELMPKNVTPFGTGTLVASNDGRFLALSTPSGVRVYSIPENPVPPPTVATLATRRDLVFDHSGKYLYVGTSTGLLERLNLSTNELEVVASLGGSLNGLDIAPDDSFLIVGQDKIGLQEGTFHKVDLTDGNVTNLNYVRAQSEGGAWDVAIGPKGLAIVTTAAPNGFSAWTPLRQVDLSTNTFTVRRDLRASSPVEAGVVRGSTHIHRSADHTRFYMLEPNASNGPIFTYDATIDKFGSNAQTQTFLDSASAAVSRDGSRVVTRHSYPNQASLDTLPDFHFIAPYDFDSGVAFDAVRDVFYAVDSRTSQVSAYDSNTGAALQTFDIGENVAIVPTPGGVGPDTPEIGVRKMVASNDGRYLAIETPGGVRVLELPSEISKAPLPKSAIFGAPRDMVFNHAATFLYISTVAGDIWPFNLATRTFEAPYVRGGQLNGIDITPDDRTLVLAQAKHGIAEGRFEKIDVDTGAVSTFAYRRDGDESSWDVAAASNTAVLATTNQRSLRTIDLSTGAIGVRTQLESGLARLRTSANGTIIGIGGQQSPRLPLLYDVSSDAFRSDPSGGYFEFGNDFSVNRDGGLFAYRTGHGTSLRSSANYSDLHLFPNLTRAIAFDSARDTLYGVDSSGDSIVGYNTATFTETSRVGLGETVGNLTDVFGPGTMVSSSDGKYLALCTSKAVRVFDLDGGRATILSTLPQVANISTRARVGTDDDVPIGGFIVVGDQPKQVAVRAVGPSLAAGTTGALSDPVLELHDATGAVIASNNNWRDAQEDEIQRSGVAPESDSEAAIVVTLLPGAYTAVVRGEGGATGIGAVEIYDLDPNAVSRLANISTRGSVGTGDDAMIAGIIIRPTTAYDALASSHQVVVRGIGPSLARANVAGTLPDPVLELRNSDGVAVAANDNWMNSPQATQIQAVGLNPSDQREAAMMLNLGPGAYTAILRGTNNSRGLAVIEVYAVE